MVFFSKKLLIYSDGCAIITMKYNPNVSDFACFGKKRILKRSDLIDGKDRK